MKTEYTIFQKILEAICAIVMIAYITYLLKSWGSIPDHIPAHFNAAGVADRWGKKSEILVLPMIGIILYIGLTVINFFPRAWNVPRVKNVQNLPFVYSTMKTMMIGIKVEIVSVFFFITHFQANAQGLPILFLPVYLVVLFGTIIFFTVKCYRA